MILSLYDFSGAPLAFTDKVRSAYREEKLNDIGTLEFHLDKGDDFFPVLSENAHLLLKQDGGGFSIVTGFELNEDLTVYCRTLNWLLSKMVLPPVSLSGTLFDICSAMLAQSFGCDISLMDCPESSEELGFKSDKAMLLSEALKMFLEEEDLGHRVRFSSGEFFLDILKGESLSFYVSESDGVLDALSLSSDILDEANAFCLKKRFLVEGSWDVYKNSPPLYQSREANFGLCYLVDTTKDSYSRFNLTFKKGDYIYCDTRDGVWKKSVSMPEPYYVFEPYENKKDPLCWYFLSSAESESDAKSELSQKTANSDFSVSVRNLSLGRDYNLGDFVKLQYNHLGAVKTRLCQFTAVTTNRDENGFYENPTLKEVK